MMFPNEVYKKMWGMSPYEYEENEKINMDLVRVNLVEMANLAWDAKNSNQVEKKDANCDKIINKATETLKLYKNMKNRKD